VVTVQDFQVRPVGWVSSPITKLEDAPCQGSGAPRARLVFEDWSARCWNDLQVSDEIFVLTWLDRADRSVFATYPEDDETLPFSGVFSTRSNDRPNPIGLHRTTIVARDADWIEVANLEVVDGTPVVDVKPVIPAEEQIA
jgi:tRNA-Thr(GGU) m(6)t(6)A37 methyltransferase TsaA